MRARDIGLGIGAFVVGMLVGEQVCLRVLADLGDHAGEVASGSFVAMAPKTFLFLGLAPFVVALALALERLGGSPAVPSALSGFFWLPLYILVTGFAARFLHIGQPPRLSTGLGFVLLLLVVPPLLDYHVLFRGWNWLRRR